MSELNPKVKYHLREIGMLVNARALRREMLLPIVDLNIRLMWHAWMLKKVELSAYGARHEVV